MSEVCPLCNKRVSDWVAASGKTLVINGSVVHKACLMEHDVSIQELEARLKEAK